MLLGAAFLLLGTGRRRIVPYLGFAVVLIGLVPAVGFLYGIYEFYGTFQTGIAWPTVLAMIGLGVGLVLSCPESGPVPLLVRHDAGGRLLRGLLPVALMLPLGLGFLRTLGQSWGLYDTAMGTGLFALAMMLIFSLMLWRSAGRLSRADSEQKRAREALGQSENRFRVAQELSLDAFAILTAVRQADGRIVDFGWEYINPTAGRILRHSPEDLVGRRLLRVLPGDQTNSDLFARYVRVVETGEAHDYELPYDSDGIQGWFRNMAVKLEDGVAVCFADITRRKQAEEALRQSETMLRRTQAIANLGSWEWDIVSGQLDWSDEVYRIFGVTPGAFTPSYDLFLSAIHVEDRDGVNERVKDALARRQPYRLECRITRPDSTIRHIVTQGDVDFDAAGKPTHMIGAVLDITQRKAAEEELKSAKLAAEQAKADAEAASKAKDHFLAVLSHELRTPLTPVLATVAMLQEDPRFDADTRDSLEVVRRNVELEARLIDDLLDVTRIERGKIELDKQPIELCTVLRRAAEVCRPDIEARKLEFGIDIADGPYVIYADAARLQQVLWNLMKNAIKFTPLGGCVGIRC